MSAYAGGADVIAHLKNGRVLKGELYVVRDDSLVIQAETKEDSLVRVGYATLGFSDLQSLTVKGKSYIAVDVVGGIVGGAAIGGLIGSNSASNENDFLGLNTFAATLGGGLLGGVIGGFLVGPIIGNALSRADIQFTEQTPGGFTTLKQFARVKEGDKP
jgi:hypothetical protein